MATTRVTLQMYRTAGGRIYGHMSAWGDTGKLSWLRPLGDLGAEDSSLPALLEAVEDAFSRCQTDGLEA